MTLGIAVDAVGDIYIADSDNYIRMVTAATGNISTVAGNGTAGYSGDGGPATSAEIDSPYGLAVDSYGNLYISDYDNYVIREVSASTGMISTVAGNGTSGYSGDGGPATSAELGAPRGVAVDGAGNLYIADFNNDLIRAVGTTQTGPVKTQPTITWAAPAPISSGTALSSTQLNATANVPGTFTYTPNSGTVLPAGHRALNVLFVPNDTTDYTPVMKTVQLTVTVSLIPATGIIQTIAGNGSWAYSGDNGPALNASFGYPLEVITDAAGNIFVSDLFNYVIRRIDGATGIISTVVGNGIAGYSGDGGLAFAASINGVGDMAFDQAGNLYLADGGNNRVRKVDMASGIITTVAGSGTAGYSGDGGLATSAELNGMSVAFDSAGNMYIGDTNNQVIREVSAQTGIISTIIGNGTQGYSGDGGPATTAELSWPQCIAFDPAGNLYFQDVGNDVIREVRVSDGTITTVVGNGTYGYSGDGGPATQAELNLDGNFVIDPAGNLFTTDSENNVVREVSATTHIITTVAGTGTPDFSGDGGPAVDADIDHDEGIRLDSAGNLYVADTRNERIRVVGGIAAGATIGVSVSPSSITMTGGQSQQFSATVTNTSNTAVTWTISPSSAASGGISSSGLYTAPASIAAQETVIVTATSVADTSKSGSATVTLTPTGKTTPTITWSAPSPITYGTALGATQLDAATTVPGTFAYSPSAGTVLNAGQQTLSVTFTPTDTTLYNTATASVTLTVNKAAPVITWNTPGPITYGTLLSSTQLDATASVPGSFVYTPGAGTIPQIGSQTLSTTFTPADTTDYTTATATATLTVNSGISVTISPSTVTLGAGMTQQFTSTVSNSPNLAVTWSINPSSAGSISASGLFTATSPISSPQTVTVTATSQEDTTKSASATVTLVTAQCATNGYGYVRAITIDHGKVANTDQVNFPVLFNVTDPSLASAPNGHVAQANGDDIIFTSDLAGQNRLDYELEKYDPATGQVVAWVKIPNLSHTTDTTIYLFYGNQNITTPQQNPASVWDTNYSAVYHFGDLSGGAAQDSTANANNGTLDNVSTATGEMDGAAGFNGTTSAVTIPWTAFTPGSGESATNSLAVEIWFKSTSHGGILGYAQGAPGSGGVAEGNDVLNLDPNGNLRGAFGGGTSQIVSSTTYNEGNWHHAVLTDIAGLETLYVDGLAVGTQQLAIGSPYGNSSQTYGLGTIQTFLWAGGNGWWWWFTGSLDEFRVSTTAETPDWILTEYRNQSSPSTFYSLSTENVMVAPNAVTLYAQQSQQFNVITPVSCNASIVWSMSSQGTGNNLGTLTQSGLYTAPATITLPETVLVTATDTLLPGSNTSSAVVTLLPPATAPKLTLTASVQPPYVTGTSQTFVANLKDEFGAGASEIQVTLTVNGVNASTLSSTTDSNGNAIFTYTGANSGTDTLQAAAALGGAQATSNSVSAIWLVPVQGISTSTVTGEFFFSPDNYGTFDIAPGTAPVFTQTFPTINFNPPAGTIPGNTSSVNVSSRPFTNVTTDLNGNFTGTIVAQGNGYQAGVGPMYTFQVALFGIFTVASAGDVVFNFYDDDGFEFGIGNGATRVSGSSLDMPTYTAFEQYPSMGAYDTSTPPVGNQVVVYFPAAGTYPYEVDYAECCGGQDVLTMTSGAVSPTGIPPTGSLALSPSTVNPLPVGGQQSFTIYAADASGAAVPNAHVTLEVTGADNLELTATTDSTGHATVVYQDQNPGNASVQAVGFISGMLSYSNMVAVPWTLPGSTVTSSGGNGTLSIGISAPSPVTLPNTLQLTGTATDSGLPAGQSPSVTWSQVSGPGTVTFANAQQAVTTAAFSTSGTYVLELSASDSLYSASVQISIEVDPAPGVTQGWIGSPLNGSPVSGVVPITVATGETLTSGTLTYYPANNPSAAVALNSNTTGSGQIGTLDTTQLQNGSYWVTLQATDTTGETSYNLALVTVVGNYKPGRVTSTVTDLVVPSTGLSISIQRTYDSLNASTSGDFGYGWSLGTNVNLSVDPMGNVTFTLGGQRRTFYLTPQWLGWVFPYYVVSYTPQPGLFGTLTDSGSGCASFLDFLVSDGSLWLCAGGGGLYNPGSYVYTDPNGTSYTISASGQLQSIYDRSGNGLTITANGITSTTGLNVPFVRDTQGRITTITDPQGNVYSYGYDANGNLDSVTYPDTNYPSQYTYVPGSHLYQSGTDFRNNPLPTTSYYGPSDTDPHGNPLSGRISSVKVHPSSGPGYTTSYAYDLTTQTTTITNPADANNNVGTTTVAYDGYGNVLTSIDPLNNTTTNVYDTHENLISTVDPLGHTITNTYDSNGNKTSTTYPATATSTNTTSTTAYNQYSEPTQTVDENGNTRNFNYDDSFNPSSVTDSLGTLSSFRFNSNQTLAFGAIGYDITTAPSRASQFTYDANGNMTSRTDALGRTTSYTYNSLGQKTSITEPVINGASAAAATTTYTYDDFGNLTQTSAPLGRVTSSTYDGNGNKLTDVDALGNTTSYQYDALNRLTTTTYPGGTTTSKTYDFRGKVITETDQAGNVTLHQYDLAGRQTSVTRAYGTANATTTTYAYDNAGRKTGEEDALGHTTSYTYDAAGNLTAMSGVKGNFTYAYDNARNQVSMTDGNSHTTHYQYDARKRLTVTTYPDGTTKTNGYDGPGNLASVTDQAGKVVQYTYDAANQLVGTTQTASPSAQNTTIVGYDADGNPVVLEDANQHVTGSLFDLAAELITRTLPDGSLSESRTYDNNGNLSAVTHFNGVTTTYAYDTLNRLISRATPGETAVSFSYYPTGKRHTMTDQSGTTTYSYDAMDRLTSKVTPSAGTLSYTYDAAGNLASMTSSNGNGVSVDYQYDDLNRLSAVIDNRLSSGASTTSYTYDTASNVATVTYPNGVQSQFTYDTLNRVSELVSSVSGYTYQRGPTGNLTGAAELNGRTLQWTFDGIYRLTDETITSDPSNKNGSVSYSLDPVGNRLSDTSSLSGISSGSATFNADDEVSTETYDQNGNTLTTGGKSFTYDSENHLTSMNAGAVSIVYDGDGNRVSKTVGGVTTYYLVDDLNPTGYPQVVEELSSSTVTRQYSYGLQRISENQVVSSAWTPSFYGYDGGGNVRNLTNLSGAVTDTYEYDAFGNELSSTGSTPNEMLYRGEQYDSDLGLYYLRARYYNPATGRFMSRDPEAGKTRKPATLHKYLYAGSDPINMHDPSGRGLLEVAWTIADATVTTLQVVCSEVIVLEFTVWVATGEEAFPEPIVKPCEAVDAAMLTAEGLFFIGEAFAEGIP